VNSVSLAVIGGTAFVAWGFQPEVGPLVETMTDFAAEREVMVERQLRRRGIGQAPILEAFLAVPREEFVDAEHAHLAYGDHPLPIEAGQTISQPYIVALMIQAAEITPDARVLEVGAGSGYAAAVISRIAKTVIAIERQADLVEVARKRLERLGYNNVEIVAGDGTRGCPDQAPFDAILAAASGSHVPPALIAQLAPEGRLVMPVGDRGGSQELIKVTKQADGILKQENLGAVRFVPLIGEEGWKDA
jgi:protein-L-isoaspartate(D-aspartate) O-methyltransferase